MFEFEDISKIIKNEDAYYAHIEQDKKEPNIILKRETIGQHTKLCQKYMEKLNMHKGIEDILERFYVQYFGKLSMEAKKLFQDMFANVITFHDIGKVNYTFQKKKMKNKNKSIRCQFNVSDGNHSLISAIFYMNYYKERINILENKEKLLLRPFILMNAYIISKHHSGIYDARVFWQYFINYDETTSKVIRLFEAENDETFNIPFQLNEIKAENFVKKAVRRLKEKQQSGDMTEQTALCYAYGRLLYSVLVSCDYYATSEFKSGYEIKDFGQLHDIEKYQSIYDNTEIVTKIRNYEKSSYPNSKLKDETDINILRSELFLDAERELLSNSEKNIMYLEAPTGSGKSNTAMNLSFRLLEKDKRLNKIYYVYPFNTLVEQNLNVLQKTFDNHEEVLEDIAVVNSLTPIKIDKNYADDDFVYQKALLDKQFLNYPFILTTHVGLFNTMFGAGKEAAFGFVQLAGSVIVLDEIQSYREKIWSDMIVFLHCFAKLLNLKIIMMSATLPNLDLLTKRNSLTHRLIKDRSKYFSHPGFKNRVDFSFELLDKKITLEDLCEHMKAYRKDSKSILIEFIKKSTAQQFYTLLNERKEDDYIIEYMSGDDSIAERNRIIHRVETDKRVILVSTQVMEAGVDIDMDIGYKDISMLDSEEQFAGRINRSSNNKGVIYYFNFDDASGIYRENVRANPDFTLQNKKIRDILKNKDFQTYYNEIIKVLGIYTENKGEMGQQEFFEEHVGVCDYEEVGKRLKLIEEDNWSMSVYLSREIVLEDNVVLNGEEIWDKYKELLEDNDMDYAEKKCELSKVRAKMNYFIYQIKKNYNLHYNDRIGDIYMVLDGEKYFTKNKLDRQKFEGEIGSFVDFI